MATPTRIDITGERLRFDDAAPGLSRIALLAGVIALVGSVLFGLTGMAGGLEALFRAYILAIMFALSFCLGGLFFVILQHLTRSGWSVTVRRLAEDIAGGVPWVGLLVLPLWFVMYFKLGGIEHVYPWLDSERVAHSELLQHKAAYLNMNFMTIRLAVYFAVWIVLAWYFRSQSVLQDRTGDPKITVRLSTVAAPAMPLFALTLTFAAIDLVMSIQPEWFSTMWGVYYFAGSVVGFFALLSILMYALQQSGRVRRVITVEHYHDVGKLVFAFIVFWCYIAFSQYMLIWYANLPEETLWYYVRQVRGWQWASIALLVGHFFVPFFVLISRVPKRTPIALALAAGWVILMHWFDLFYCVMPHIVEGESGAITGPPFALHLVDITCTIGVVGIVAFGVIRNLGSASLIPEKDPYLARAVAFQNI